MNKLKLYTKNNKIKKISILASASSLLFTGLRMMANPYAAAGTFLLYQSPDLRNYLYNAVVGPEEEGVEDIDSSKIEAEFEKFLDDFKIKYNEFSEKLSEDEELINLHAIICAKIATKENPSYEEESLDSKFKEKYNLFILKAFKPNVLTEFTSDLNEPEQAQFNQMKLNFKRKLEECSEESFSEIVSEGEGTRVLVEAFEGDKEFTEGKLTQARTADVDSSDERMSVYEKNQIEADRLMKQMEQSQRVEEAEAELLNVTRPGDSRIDGSRIVDNLNWYIRLEQNIEDEGSGFFGMYNKFKKLSIFSFIKAQSKENKFSKGSRQVNRRYSSILMSGRDSRYRTEIFEASEYDRYPYYIKQRILILKFLKNELGPKFDSIYNKKMNEIESSNYADDGEFSVMPNKLARAINKIIKSAEVTEAYVENANKFLTYFRKLIDGRFTDQEEVSASLLELKNFKKQTWSGSAFGSSGKAIGLEYGNHKPDYDNVMGIFKEVFEKDFTKVPFGSFVKFITGTSNYSEESSDKVGELITVLSSLKDLLKNKKAEELKNYPTNYSQARAAEVDADGLDDEIKEIDQNHSERALRMAMKTDGYVSGSVRKVPDETNLKNLGIVTIDEKPYVSKWNGSKEVIRYEQVKKVGEKYQTMRGGTYYYWIGTIEVEDSGSTEIKNVFMTNSATENTTTLSVTVDENLPGSASPRDLPGIFINTSDMFGAKAQGGDDKRTFFQSYSYEKPEYKAHIGRLKELILKDSVKSIAYPVGKDGAILIDGNPSQIQKGKGLRINDQKINPESSYYLEAGKKYTATKGLDFGFFDINIKAEDVSSDFLKAINNKLAVTGRGHYANPGILYYLNANETAMYLKFLALYGFVITNQGFLIPKERAEEAIKAYSTKLGEFYKEAKSRSEK